MGDKVSEKYATATCVSLDHVWGICQQKSTFQGFPQFSFGMIDGQKKVSPCTLASWTPRAADHNLDLEF
jgi:hypothetical protein